MSKWITFAPGANSDSLPVTRSSKGDHEVALIEGPVGVLRAVHAGRAEVQRVAVWQSALPHQGDNRRHVQQLDELEQLACRVAVQDTAADVEDRTLRREDCRRSVTHLPRVHLRGRAPAGEVGLIRIAEVESGLLHVLRHVDENRPAAAGRGHVERVLHGLRELLDVLNEPRVLDDRQRDAGRVDLLERVTADQLATNLAGDADERRRVHPRVRDRGHEVCRARA
jgi:hypothetical protein